MRHLFTLLGLLAALFFSASSFSIAQTCLEPGAVPIDTILVTTTFGSTGSASLSRIDGGIGMDGSSSTGQTAWLVVVTQLTSGQINYSIDAPSITFSGDGSVVDGMTTSQLFSLMAQATVQRGIDLGYTPCSALCTGEIATRVSQSSCVERTGTGTATHFTPCGADCGFRDYAVCCQNPTPTITLVQTSGGACSGPCQPTCAGEWQGGIGSSGGQLK